MLETLKAIAGLAGGLGQFAGGAAGLFRGGGGTPDTSTFYQNWRNDDLRMWQAQFDENKFLAREGIRVRVADAKAAGIHPLYALGAPTFQPGSIPIASQGPSDFGTPGVGPDVGRALDHMGQGVDRAVRAVSPKAERVVSDLERAQTAAAMGTANASNAQADYYRAKAASEIARTGPSQVGPPAPVPNVGSYEAKPPEVSNPSPGSRGMIEAGPGHPSVAYRITNEGAFLPIPPKNVVQDQEFFNPMMLEWMHENRITPFFGGKRPPPPNMAAVKQVHPDAVGVEWSWSQLAYVPVFARPPARSRSAGPSLWTGVP